MGFCGLMSLAQTWTPEDAPNPRTGMVAFAYAVFLFMALEMRWIKRGSSALALAAGWFLVAMGGFFTIHWWVTVAPSEEWSGGLAGRIVMGVLAAYYLYAAVRLAVWSRPVPLKDGIRRKLWGRWTRRKVRRPPRLRPPRKQH